MADGMRKEQFSPHDGNGALPRGDLRKLDNDGTRDLRPQTEHDAWLKTELAQSLFCAKPARRESKLTQKATRSRGVSAPVSTCPYPPPARRPAPR